MYFLHHGKNIFDGVWRGRKRRIECYSSTFRAMKATYLTGSSEEEYGESRLKHVFSAVGDRCMGLGLDSKDMMNGVSVLHAWCY